MFSISTPSFGAVTQLEQVAISELRPTQVTVGYREVKQKRREWREDDAHKRREFLRAHLVPTVIGPNGRHYLTDHHHLARALLEEEHKSVWAGIIADLSHLKREEFWTVMDHRALVHAFDVQGERVPYEDIPKSVAKLKDDPFRSLAGAVRNSGGFAKNTAPFSEFLWADFFRRRLGRKEVEDDFKAATVQALELAHSTEAEHLPGWSSQSGKPSES